MTIAFYVVIFRIDIFSAQIPNSGFPGFILHEILVSLERIRFNYLMIMLICKKLADHCRVEDSWVWNYPFSISINCATTAKIDNILSLKLIEFEAKKYYTK